MNECPCGSGKTYAECCEPIITGKLPAPTPEALMRSRYTAFVLGDMPHLKNSLAPRSRKSYDEKSVKQWSQSVEWLGLTIHETQGGGEADNEGVVKFTAQFSVQEKPQDFTETARFKRIDGSWYYVDGDVDGATPVRRDAPKVGRNDPCPCGSGAKHKKCCGR